jgi:hypothetical protein
MAFFCQQDVQIFPEDLYEQLHQNPPTFGRCTSREELSARLLESSRLYKWPQILPVSPFFEQLFSLVIETTTFL